MNRSSTTPLLWKFDAAHGPQYFSSETPRRSRSQSSLSTASSHRDVRIQVACRVRPAPGPSAVVLDGSKVSVGLPGEAQEQVIFDQVFGPRSTQDDVYRQVAEPVVQEVLNGVNGTVFCYGQTGSGKTYTMEGTADNPGLLPRLGKSLFQKRTGVLQRERVIVSVVEIYMEKLRDLLEPSNVLEVRETLAGSVYIANAAEREISSPEDLLKCLYTSQKARSVTRATKMNEYSSRSHFVFSVAVRQRNTVTGFPVHGVLHFVDLAGSESQAKTGAKGQTLEEAKHINQSLFALERVVSALGTRQNHVPFRDAKLTRILQDSLGGNARTSVIVNLKPEACNAQESLSTLRFAQRAQLVKNVPRQNFGTLSNDQLRKLLSERDAEIARLRAQVAQLEDTVASSAPSFCNLGSMLQRQFSPSGDRLTGQLRPLPDDLTPLLASPEEGTAKVLLAPPQDESSNCGICNCKKRCSVM